MKLNKGFTLIELLIVVLIIAILAAIAVPNFLEFQTRAKVARAKSDMRNIATALEAYVVDYDEYPAPISVYQGGLFGFWIGYAVELTTPVAYMTKIDHNDPFNPPGKEATDPNFDGTYEYFNLQTGWGGAMPDGAFGGSRRAPGYAMMSWGPDTVRGNPSATGNAHGPHIALWPSDGNSPNNTPWSDLLYDPTNGTVSGGDIIYLGGEVPVMRWKTGLLN